MASPKVGRGTTNGILVEKNSSQLMWHIAVMITAFFRSERKSDADVNRYQALKVLRAEPVLYDVLYKEVEILKRVRDADPTHPGYEHVVHLINDFHVNSVFGTHIAMLFPVFGQTLQPSWTSMLPVRTLREVMKQLLLALDYLHSKCGVIHTDIKGSNIMLQIQDTHAINKQIACEPARALANVFLKNEIRQVVEIPISQSQPISVPIFGRKLKICLADFGTAEWASSTHQTVILGKLLRPPEVVLNGCWDCTVDIWATGCFIVEMLDGSPLFQWKVTKNIIGEQHYLSTVTKQVGPVPLELQSRCTRWREFFNDKVLLRRPTTKVPSIRERLVARHSEMSPLAADSLTALVLQMMRPNPAHRCSAAEALRHEWFDLDLEEGAREISVGIDEL
ncbi:kinase-like protein [Dacryopinax primogenitus]|uniref:non-specific serine/threonine protein kinase n=1 Tax=Dacryopinax primogenitus (strain DJM 731) TaxID=1858805 RepID=M5G3B6_DACPD|nr:kinase-like protein [Dacryopinax primogenitus]EJU00372.1 kinase-like protein [Dacryopinax primogenitus]